MPALKSRESKQKRNKIEFAAEIISALKSQTELAKGRKLCSRSRVRGYSHLIKFIKSRIQQAALCGFGGAKIRHDIRLET